MGTNNCTEDFKRGAVCQITERGYPVAEVSQRLGVSAHSLYAWRKKYASEASKGGDGVGWLVRAPTRCASGMVRASTTFTRSASWKTMMDFGCCAEAVRRR